jgi:hypothetical protein
MLPVLIGAGIAAGVGLIGKAISSALEAGKYEEAQRIRDEALAEYGPDLLPKLKVELQNYQIPSSVVAGLTGDKESIGMQRRALAELSNQAYGNPDDAQLSLSLLRAQDAARGEMGRNQASILENLRNQGQFNRTGVAAQMAAGQQSANLVNRQGLEAAAMAEQRKQRALSELMSGASNMRNQSFNERVTAGGAQDSLNRANTQMKYNAQQQYYDQVNQDFMRKLQLANARANVKTGQANAVMGEGQRQGNVAESVAGGIAGTASTLGNAFQQRDYLNQVRQDRREDLDYWRRMNRAQERQYGDYGFEDEDERYA